MPSVGKRWKISSGDPYGGPLGGMLQLNSNQPTSDLMTNLPISPCSDLATRELKWLWQSDQLKNYASRPSMFIHWGVPAYIIAAQCAEVHADEVAPCPISGWRY